MTPTKTTPKIVLYTAAADIVLVLLFALSGRRSHSASLTAGGVLVTAWPFLAALAAGWLITRLWKAPLRLWQQPLRVWPHGVCLWLITVAGGMLLRVLSGSTAELPFVIVATLVLALFLLGHRFIAARATRRIPQP